MKSPWLVFIILCICGAHFTLTLSSSDQAYYWRDFTGTTIPDDAVPARNDKLGRTTYIGQAIHVNGALIPGQIDAHHKVLIYHYDAKGYKVTRNVKILCSPHKNWFEWIATNDVDLRYLTQKHLVPGGFDEDYPLLIGRAPKSGEVVVGKIGYGSRYIRFTYVVDGRAPHEHNYYEVLSYNERLGCEFTSRQVKIQMYCNNS